MSRLHISFDVLRTEPFYEYNKLILNPIRLPSCKSSETIINSIIFILSNYCVVKLQIWMSSTFWRIVKSISDVTTRSSLIKYRKEQKQHTKTFVYFEQAEWWICFTLCIMKPVMQNKCSISLLLVNLRESHVKQISFCRNSIPRKNSLHSHCTPVI